MILRNNHFIFEAAYSLILFIRREFLYIFVYLFDDSIRLHQTFQNVLYGFAKFLQELGQELLSPTFVTVVIIDIRTLFSITFFYKSEDFRELKKIYLQQIMMIFFKQKCFITDFYLLCLKFGPRKKIKMSNHVFFSA